jgi:pyrimidine operon attenuation protein/uracil phosphoribosyltransferase
MSSKTQILNATQAAMKLNRIAYEIVENNMDEKEIILAGILDRGYSIAILLKKYIQAVSKMKVTLLSIKINKENPLDARIVEETELKNKIIILVDDVANSGCTLLYAAKLFLESLPKKIQIAVLVDRKHKRFPVSSDYIGLVLSTTLQEHITVAFEQDQVKGAYLS